MKKFLIIFLILFLMSCSSLKIDSTSEQQDNIQKQTVSEKDNEPSQEKLNEQLKAEAVQADIVELNVENPPKGKKVFAAGKVFALTEGPVDQFTLTTDEASGHGIYKVTLANTTDIEFSDGNGDGVKIYGVVSGKDQDGTPMIAASILEKIE